MGNFRILIIGSGVAGLTCAGLLKQRGLTPTVIEKTAEKDFHDGGYMLGLLPLGSRVLTELGLQKEYFAQSVEMRTYELGKQNGDSIKKFPLDFINEKYASYRGIGRAELLEVLFRSFDKKNIIFGTTATKIVPKENSVDVEFSDGSKDTFDIVIGADGMHSLTRKMLWKENEYQYYDTNWGCWVVWLDKEKSKNYSFDTYKEHWGASCFFGVYPVKDKIGVLVGGPNSLTEKLGVQALVDKVKKGLHKGNEHFTEAFDILAKTKNPFYWELHDCRSKTWRKGNVILLGDAAAGFLPTAGVGASMAMDSAAALVDELSRTDKEHIVYGLDLFIKKQKERVEIAQQDSRNLGKMMFVKSPFIAAIRNYFMRFYTIEMLVKNISKIIEGK